MGGEITSYDAEQKHHVSLDLTFQERACVCYIESLPAINARNL